jgi:hypothetical protein
MNSVVTEWPFPVKSSLFGLPADDYDAARGA